VYPVTARYLDAVRSGRRSYPKATHRNLETGKSTPLVVLDGQVVDDANAKIRRTLTLTLAASKAVWDAIDAPGGEITVSKVTKYVDGSPETVPLGTFIVDSEQIDDGPDGTITLTCPDRWLKVQRNNFGLTRASVPGNAAWQEIQRLVEAPWGASFPGWTQLDTTATTKVGPLVWQDGNRETAITGLLEDNGLEVYFDRAGKAVLRPVPSLSSTSKAVWTVDAGTSSAVMVSSTRTRSRERVRNAVIATTSATDVIFDPVEVKNTTAGDPLRVGGPLGYVPYEYSSPTLRNSTQARTAALTILRRQLGVAEDLTLTAFVNDALDSLDVIKAVMPRLSKGDPTVTKLHILDQVTTPLKPDGAQPLVTRSTRPDTDGT
jgi:hypothetical protein